MDFFEFYGKAIIFNTRFSAEQELNGFGIDFMGKSKIGSIRLSDDLLQCDFIIFKSQGFLDRKSTRLNSSH